MGSTAVKYLPAKPILDILAGISPASTLDSFIQPFQELGYTYIRKFEKDIPERRFFIFFNDFPKKIIDFHDDFPSGNLSRIFHLHVFHFHTNEWIRHIAVRNFLRKRKKERENYRDFKLELTQSEFSGSLEYSEAKNHYMKSLEKRAMDWYAHITNST